MSPNVPNVHGFGALSEGVTSDSPRQSQHTIAARCLYLRPDLAIIQLYSREYNMGLRIEPGGVKMERFFNTAGPMIPEDHYCIDPLTRVDWDDIQRLIRDKRYFVMHAPRQTGKTSTLRAMMDALNKEGKYACAYANIESAQTARE